MSRHGEEGAEAETFEAIAQLEKIAKDAGITISQVRTISRSLSFNFSFLNFQYQSN
jgi:hypothetical protein